MNLAVQVLVANAPQLAVIWLLLIAMAVAAVLAMAQPAVLNLPGLLAARLADRAARLRCDRESRAGQAADTLRYAEEIAFVADRATITVQRRREQWHEAQRRLDDAWQAAQDADDRVTVARNAAAYRPPTTALTPVEYAARERYLHTAAGQAFDRGYLAPEQLRDALAARNGWNPTLHPADQDVVLAVEVRTHLRHRYERATAAERTAWHEVGMSIAAARSARAESDLAQVAARRHRRRATPALSLAGRPHPAPRFA